MLIAIEPFDGAESAELMGELSAELRDRYGGDFEPGTKPNAGDVAVFLVARGDTGRPLGCGALRRLGGDVAEMKRMYVRPEARGRGLGWELLLALEAQARRLGIQVLRLETGVEQPEAAALYERAGYRRIPCFGPYAGEALSTCYEKRVP